MTVSTTRTIEEKQPLTIVQRIAGADRSAVKDCADTYDNFIWALAKKFTRSTAEAEAAAREIFIDIWRYAERGNNDESAEKLLIALIARRRLMKQLQ